MLADIRYALRTLTASPGFTIAAIVTLALGIGANTAIFAVAFQAFLKPLPFPDEDRLVVVRQTYGKDKRINPVAPGNFGDWRDENRTFASLAAYSQYTRRANLTGSGEPQSLLVGHVSGNFFGTLGMVPRLGRALLPADDAGDARVIVLRESAWRAKFGAVPDVVGRRVLLNGDPYEVVGVMPDAAVIGSVEAEAWAPLALRGERAAMRQAFYLGAIGRLRHGVTIAQAGEDLQRISERAAALHQGMNRDLGAGVAPFRAELVSGFRPAILLLLGGAALVLIVATANLAGLQLARDTGRAQELAIRSALGGSRLRILRELAIEGLLVAGAGAFGGVTLGMWALSTLAHFAPPDLARNIVIRPDAAVISFAIAIALASSAVFSVWPGWRATTALAQTTLGARGQTLDRASTRLRSLLVGAEVAVAAVVLIGASLLVASLVNVMRVDPGFEFDRGLVIGIALPEADYPTLETRVRFFDRLIEATSAVPGVEAACVMNHAPMTGQRGSMTFVAEGERRMVSSVPSSVSDGCIGLLRVPLRKGRLHSTADDASSVLISESMARALFRDADPIGRRVHRGLPGGPLLTVVGVVGNIRHVSLESRNRNQVWMSYRQPAFGPEELLVRSSVPPATLVDLVRARIRELDARLPATAVRTMADMRAEQLAPRRFTMQLIVEFGVVALVLSALGIYGLLSQVVGHRTKEIGVRLALGATPAHVVRHIVAGTAVAVVCGCVAGAAAAWWLSRLVRLLLFEVSPTEPRIYAAALTAIVLAALASAWYPARRAAHTDPAVALRPGSGL